MTHPRFTLPKSILSRKAGRENGVALIIVIIVVAFMFTVGLALLSVTRSGPNVAANMRWHQTAFNAAEAGVDAALKYIGENMADFYGQCRTTYSGSSGLDDPASPNFFRKLTDAQILADIQTNADNYIYSAAAMPYDNNFTYTAFLVDDDGGGPTPDSTDAILVCIGHGPQNTYVRLEINLAIQ
jgi:hypothetical protein